eukprot:gnl/Trimastix_PCT/3086.p1 GENE.gnl/Trimastix_PCT/3086~~gnl/Trimastix_PCT/3086.p1  ORF type:complete len:131 (-),score=6.04 gnl/Trimastix_PCT/3086:349-741(-)
MEEEPLPRDWDATRQAYIETGTKKNTVKCYRSWIGVFDRWAEENKFACFDDLMKTSPPDGQEIPLAEVCDLLGNWVATVRHTNGYTRKSLSVGINILFGASQAFVQFVLFTRTPTASAPHASPSTTASTF